MKELPVKSRQDKNLVSNFYLHSLHMKVIIQISNFRVRKNLFGFVQEKLDKLQSLIGNILEGRMYLKLEKSDARGNKVCEIKLLIPGNELFVSSQSNTF